MVIQQKSELHSHRVEKYSKYRSRRPTATIIYTIPITRHRAANNGLSSLALLLPLELIKLGERKPYTEDFTIQIHMIMQRAHERCQPFVEHLSVLSCAPEDAWKGFACGGEVSEEAGVGV